MATNVTGPMMGIQLCASLMKESGGGSIINIASLGGMHGALRGLSASAAYSLASWGYEVM